MVTDPEQVATAKAMRAALAEDRRRREAANCHHIDGHTVQLRALPDYEALFGVDFANPNPTAEKRAACDQRRHSEDRYRDQGRHAVDDRPDQGAEDPTIATFWEELAEQARDQNWSHEEYLAALQRQVADRESNGTVMRIRTAHFPQVKTLEDSTSTICRRCAATSWRTWRPGRSSPRPTT